MLKITRVANGEVIFRLSGRVDAENIAELEGLFNAETKGCRIVLDLNNLTLLNREAIIFLAKCEADRVQIKNCPPYVREWIARERRAKKKTTRRTPGERR